MKVNNCETHIDQALDVWVEKEESFSQISFIPEDEKLSTKHTDCEELVLYVVANE
ncbi:CxxH/CxxC protein [Sporosarcina sp. 179-K 3D1 HS]|uniref:CxxH/CxxC protein n=1 Tax=Sporosarcina sp. 179-K 3D1 HS TaxID=3232169 RepID=UPI0039A00854